MMVKMQIHLSDDELQALQAISAKEMRPIREQIRYMLRLELQQRGYLQIAASEAIAKQPKKVSASSQEDQPA